MINKILEKEVFSKADIVRLLQANSSETAVLFQHSAKIKEHYIGNYVYLRGLIEFSNICTKDCLYCGIRRSNTKPIRYTISNEAILAAADFAYTHNYGSLALQSGEIQSPSFSHQIENLLYKIQERSHGELGITLSCGEQDANTYKRWRKAGASRYLLRIESSNKTLYQKLHPNNNKHSFDKRIESLYMLKDMGYQTGTGVMIGLPYQTTEHLAEDLLFMQTLDIDMCGMGPYINHPDTPLSTLQQQLLPLSQRLNLSLKMLAILRIMMKDINIAATTALQAIHPNAREKAIEIAANVLMPNLTPQKYNENYHLYQNKPTTKALQNYYSEHPEGSHFGNAIIGFGKQGNSPHYFKKKADKTNNIRTQHTDDKINI